MWKPILNFEGYEVSDDGKVRSWKPERNNVPAPTEPRLLKFEIGSSGYYQLNLYSENGRKMCRVHVLVAEAFHGTRPEGFVVRHLNGIRTDNRAANLRWGTVQENNDDMRLHGTWSHGEGVHTSKLSELDVLQILNSNDRPIDIASVYGVTPANICHIRKGRSWKHLTKEYIK